MFRFYWNGANGTQTVCCVQNYTVHRNEQAFPDPEAFYPERWLSKEGEDLRKAAFNPFSVGQRSCIGIKYV